MHDTPTPPVAPPAPSGPPSEHERRRARWRADHRGTREADFLVGGFADRYLASMTRAEFSWFEALMREQDADILLWAMGKASVPRKYHGPMLERLQKLDYIRDLHD